MSVPSTQWAACWEGTWGLWYFRRHIHCRRGSVWTKATSGAFSCLCRGKQVHPVSLISSLRHSSEPSHGDLLCTEKGFPGSPRPLTMSQHLTLWQPHTHTVPSRTGLAQPMKADGSYHEAAFWAILKELIPAPCLENRAEMWCLHF